MTIADLRREYARESLTERDVESSPIQQFERWFAQARSADVPEPNAMSLATSSADGQPSVRIVLLKGLDENGFVFFTDYRSQKANDLAANPRASLCFFWPELERQVRISGTVSRVSQTESAEYFRSRPHGSRVGAWASHQSSPLSAREKLEAEVLRLLEKYPEGSEVPLPPHWGGFRVTPDAIEFWQGRLSRLHDRIFYRRSGENWELGRLSP